MPVVAGDWPLASEKSECSLFPAAISNILSSDSKSCAVSSLIGSLLSVGTINDSELE